MQMFSVFKREGYKHMLLKSLHLERDDRADNHAVCIPGIPT